MSFDYRLCVEVFNSNAAALTYVNKFVIWDNNIYSGLQCKRSLCAFNVIQLWMIHHFMLSVCYYFESRTDLAWLTVVSATVAAVSGVRARFAVSCQASQSFGSAQKRFQLLKLGRKTGERWRKATKRLEEVSCTGSREEECSSARGNAVRAVIFSLSGVVVF